MCFGNRPVAGDLQSVCHSGFRRPYLTDATFMAAASQSFDESFVAVENRSRTSSLWFMLAMTFAVLHASLVTPSVLQAASPPLKTVEITVNAETRNGRMSAHNAEAFWLLERGGRLSEHQFEELTAFKVVGTSFQPSTALQIKADLSRELGKRYSVATRGRYVVAGVGSGTTQRYAEVFDGLYRDFRQYFSVRGFKIPEPEFPLVAVVYPDQQAFAQQARKDGVNATAGLLGYYHLLSNRVSLVSPGRVSVRPDDKSSKPQAKKPDRSLSTVLRLNDPWRIPTRFDARSRDLEPTGLLAAVGYFDAGKPWHVCAIESNLEDTIVHEATHQVAYNTGLHNRMSNQPRWMIEGLATVFEADGQRSREPNASLLSRANRERLVWFGGYRASRRQKGSLAAIVEGDAPFQRQTLDAYSEAWALTFFLIETRSSQYARYLRLVNARDPLVPYKGKQRLEDFVEAFGDDLKLLEAHFLRFIDSVK